MGSNGRSPKGQVYQTTITIVGLGVWLFALCTLPFRYSLKEQLPVLAFVPVIIVASMFVQHFRMPSGLRFTHERLTFTLSDAIVLLAICWCGITPAIFLAGIEGFTTSRRTVRRLSSNLFSSGMMVLAAGAAALGLQAVLRFGFGEPVASQHHTAIAVSVAMLFASLLHNVVNMGLLSTLLALRHNNSIIREWREKLIWCAPMFLPTGTAASLMYFARQFDMLFLLVICAPVFIAIHFGHRRYRDSVASRIEIMEKAHRETIEALAVAINAKDQVTHEHVLRVQIYAAGVARLLNCTPPEIEALRAGALLHDIGKIAVPDYILNKPGKLTSSEFEKMKTHTLVGAQILGRVEFPYPIVPVVRHHHERWDGKGYPDGLHGNEIPLTARILSVVDCFDAVREDRQYRRGMTREQAIDLIMEGSGTQYDPRVVGIFLTHLPEFEAEIQAQRDQPTPTYGIEASEKLSEAAQAVAPAAGLAVESESAQPASNEKLTERELKSLAELAHTVEGLRNAEAIAAAFMERLRTMIPYETCAITLTQQAAGKNMIMHAAGEHAALIKGRIVGQGDGVTGWVVANGQPFCNTDPKLDFSAEIAVQFQRYRTLASFPISNNARETCGALTLYSSTLKEYKGCQQKLLEAAAMILSTALSPAPITQEGLALVMEETNAPQPMPPLSFKTSIASLDSELTH